MSADRDWMSAVSDLVPAESAQVFAESDCLPVESGRVLLSLIGGR